MGPFVSCQAWLVVLVRCRRTHTAFSQAVDGEQPPSEQHFGLARRARGLNNPGKPYSGSIPVDRDQQRTAGRRRARRSTAAPRSPWGH